MEHSGDQQRDRGQRELGGARACARRIELLNPVLHAPGDHRGAEDQQRVPDDRSRERRLHDLGESLAQRDDRDHDLGHVPERRVQEPPDPFPGARGEVLGRLPHPARDRDDRDPGEEEEPHVGLGGEEAQADRHRRQQQEPVQGRAEPPRHGGGRKHSGGRPTSIGHLTTPVGRGHVRQKAAPIRLPDGAFVWPAPRSTPELFTGAR